MKKILFILFCFFSTALFSQDITVVQINAHWNSSNTRRDFVDLKGCKYNFVWLEDQPEDIRSQIRSVPVLLIYKGNNLVKAYQANIILELDIPYENVQQEIWAIKENN